MNETVIYEQDEHIVTLTLNQPDRRNPISEPEVVNALEAAIKRINLDTHVRAVVITGAGRVFSAGGDLEKMSSRSGMFQGSATQLRDSYRYGIQRIPLAMQCCEVPTIAAVNGPAIGAGCDLACMCDIRLASTEAVFAESFVKLGIVPGDGGAWLLPRAVGLSRACEMAFTGDRIDAKMALAWGLVSRLVPAEELLDCAYRLAGRIAANPSHALRMTKRLLLEGQHLRLDSLLEMSASMQALAHQSRDHAEAMNAWIERRQPVFDGE